MKKYIFAIAAVIAAVSCSKESIQTENAVDNQTFRFTAVPEEVLTSASLAEDGKSIAWKVGDKVTTCFENSITPNNAVWGEASVVSVDANGVATFAGALPENANTSSMYAIYNNYADYVDMHPYIVKDEAAYTRHRVCFPAAQTAVVGSFDTATLPLPGYWSGTPGETPEIHFKNVATLLRFGIKNTSSEEISSVVIANTSVPLSGVYYWNSSATPGEVYLKSSTQTTKDVTLSGTFAGEGTYYAIIPGETSDIKGLSIKFLTNSGKTATFSNPISLSRERNRIYNIGSFTLTDENFVSGSDGIEFSDTKVNMDDSFYTKLVEKCTGTESPYSLSESVLIDKMRITPLGGSYTSVIIGDKKYISRKTTCKFASASAGDAILVLYCAIKNGKAISLTWTDKEGKGKTVPTEVVNALNNTTTSTFYYDTDSKALQLSLPGVEVGDEFVISLSGTDSHRLYKFYWKEKKTE